MNPYAPATTTLINQCLFMFISMVVRFIFPNAVVLPDAIIYVGGSLLNLGLFKMALKRVRGPADE